jgi:hypothetical protein
MPICCNDLAASGHGGHVLLYCKRSQCLTGNGLPCCGCQWVCTVLLTCVGDTYLGYMPPNGNSHHDQHHGRKLSMSSKAAGSVVMAGHSAAQHWHVDALTMSESNAAMASVLSEDRSATITLKLKAGGANGNTTGTWLLRPGCACRFKGLIGFVSCVWQVLVKDCE